MLVTIIFYPIILLFPALQFIEPSDDGNYSARLFCKTVQKYLERVRLPYCIDGSLHESSHGK
jgi:hypothetical protein